LSTRDSTEAVRPLAQVAVLVLASVAGTRLLLPQGEHDPPSWAMTSLLGTNLDTGSVAGATCSLPERVRVCSASALATAQTADDYGSDRSQVSESRLPPSIRVRDDQR
jgi:hypothetical protein